MDLSLPQASVGVSGASCHVCYPRKCMTFYFIFIIGDTRRIPLLLPSFSFPLPSPFASWRLYYPIAVWTFALVFLASRASSRMSCYHSFFLLWFPFLDTHHTARRRLLLSTVGQFTLLITFDIMGHSFVDCGVISVFHRLSKLIAFQCRY